MNQLSHGQKITIPGSVVRSVSFDKIRQGSLSSRNTKPDHNQKKSQHQQKINQPSSHTTTGLCQRLLSQKLTTNNPNNRNQIGTKTFEQRAILIKKQLQQKQMKQCTFKPKLNKITNTQRTVQQFVHQQLIYQKNKIDKVNQMRQIIRAKIDKQNTFQPNLMIQNKNQNNKKISGAVYQRLYEQGIKRQQNIIVQSVQKRPNSKQKITTISRKNSQKSIIQSYKGSKKHLPTISNNDLPQYNSQSSKQHTIHNQHQSQSQCQFPSQDIIQKHDNSQQHTSRQNSKSHKGVKITKNMDIQVQQICDKKISYNNNNNNKTLQQKQKQKKQNLKNKQLYIKKIIRQISHILSQTQINTINLNYIQLSLILQKMNFLNQKTNINDRKYSYQIWQMLQGDLYQNIPLVNLIRIIFCLLGCYQQNIIQQYLLLLIPQNIHNNINNTKKLVLTQKQSKNIKINFQELTLNRLRLGQYIISQPKQQNYTFKPNISKCTNQLAGRYRQRVIQESQQLLNTHHNNGNGSNNNNSNKFLYQKLDIQTTKNTNGLDHIDLLYLDQKRKQLKIQIKRQKIQQQRKKLQDQAMISQKNKYNSNKDNNNNNSRDNKYRNQCNNGGNNNQPRFQHLYQLGKNILRTKKIQNNDNNPISKQCTFHPNINSSQNYMQYQSQQQHSQSQSQSQSQFHNISNSSNTMSIKNSHILQKSQNNSKQNSNNSNDSKPQDKYNPIDEIKDFDKSIFRMYEARRIRQQSNNHNHNHNINQQYTYQSDRSLLSSSQNPTNNHKTKYTQHQQHISSLSSQSPILYLNICMQGINDIKIPVFYNDNMKTITHKVKILMGLENTQDQKLEEILKIQILPSLKEIGLGDDF